jgi:hypothetical protein
VICANCSSVEPNNQILVALRRVAYSARSLLIWTLSGNLTQVIRTYPSKGSSKGLAVKEICPCPPKVSALMSLRAALRFIFCRLTFLDHLARVATV